MSADVRDRVWEWLHNPKIIDRWEWAKMRGPVMSIIAAVTEVILCYGSPLQREVLRRGVEKLLKSHLEKSH